MISSFLRRSLFNRHTLEQTKRACAHPGTTTSNVRYIGSESGAYQGDGKTIVRVLNNEELQLNLINTYSDKGFRLSNNLFIYGSIVLFPTHIFSWNVKRGLDITEDSLLIFDLIVPKTKIVIIGYGQRGEPYDASLPGKLKKKGISCEILPTPHAVTTYNYLVHDSVHVAGAFVPMKDEVDMTMHDARGLHESDIMNSQRDFMPRDISYMKENWDKIKEYHDKGKKPSGD